MNYDPEKEFCQKLQTNPAYLAKSVFDLHSLIQAQSEELYIEKQMGFPVWVSSTLLYFSKAKKASIMQIAKALNLPHQLVSKRIKMLLKLKLISGFVDPMDKRKTIYCLTEAGVHKTKVLDLYSSEAAKAFNGLSKELGVDLQKILNEAISALKNKPFGQRFPLNERSYSQQVEAENEDE